MTYLLPDASLIARIGFFNATRRARPSNVCSTLSVATASCVRVRDDEQPG